MLVLSKAHHLVLSALKISTLIRRPMSVKIVLLDVPMSVISRLIVSNAQVLMILTRIVVCRHAQALF